MVRGDGRSDVGKVVFWCSFRRAVYEALQPTIQIQIISLTYEL